MAKAWQSVLSIQTCAVAAYSTAGVLLTPAQLTTNGIVITQNASGSVTVTALAASVDFYVRLTPNHGAGVGSSAARITILAAAELDAAAPRWDAAGTWAIFNGPASLTQPGTGNWTYLEIPVFPDGIGTPTVTALVEVFFDELSTAAYNCSCSGDDGVQYRTLLQLRQEMLVGLGRGNQLTNPGVGTQLLVDMHLRNAQNLLYNRAPWLVMERYFSWPLLEGVRLYGLYQNAEACSVRINPNKIKWAGYVRDTIYYPMRQGINPSLYSYLTVTGYPQRFEIRQCIEVWPAPDVTEGSFVIKGDFGLLPLVADADVASIDDYLICQLALGTLKRHFRQPDAADYIQAGEVLLNNLVAGTHTGMARYIPGRDARRDVTWVQPVADPPFPGAA